MGITNWRTSKQVDTFQIHRARPKNYGGLKSDAQDDSASSQGTQATSPGASCNGPLDAAYITPSGALAARHASRCGFVIISGAAATRGTGAPRAAAILTATRAFLSRHPAWANDLLSAQVFPTSSSAPTAPPPLRPPPPS